MIAYFETSGLVKLLIEEPGSTVAAALWDAAESVFSSRLAYPEARAALAAARRGGRLSGEQLSNAKASLERRFATIAVVEVTSEIARLGGERAEAHALRGYDALHLASALIIPPADLVMVTWDKDLAGAAEAAGLTIAGIRP